MNEEVKNNENKKKQKVALLIGLVTLLIAVLGATYAFFQINTDNESSNTNITGSTPPKSLVTLKGVTSNLHLNISASDMSESNMYNEYYGTDVEEKSYEENEENGTKTIAEVELKGGEATTKYSCTAKLIVSKVTEPNEDKDTMIEVLQPGDMILQFKGNIISEKLDLSELNPDGSKEYDLSFKVTGNKVEEIQAYIKLLNKDEPQNYLSGKKLNLDINTSDLKCNVYIPDPKIAQLRENDQNGTLSKEIVGGMYRYQGVDEQYKDDIEINPKKLPAVNNNYICFGTDNKEECTNEETGIDKYMYRIIGITEEGQLYLIKETFLKEGNTTRFLWNSKSEIQDCLGDACEWPNIDLYKRLNGETSNGNPIFVNNPIYDYMQEGNPWYNKIEEHNWLYGDLGQFNDEAQGEIVYGVYENNGLVLYDVETGIKPAYYVYHDEPVKYFWSDEISAKIGVKYIHDYYLACDDEEKIKFDGNYTSNWLYNNSAGDMTMPRYYENSVYFEYHSWGIEGNGQAGTNTDSFKIHPVFYLSSNAKIKDGDGTKSNPYILDVQEA